MEDSSRRLITILRPFCNTLVSMSFDLPKKEMQCSEPAISTFNNKKTQIQYLNEPRVLFSNNKSK